MLRAATEIAGFKLRAGEDEIGSIEDIFFDDHRWQVIYFVVRAPSGVGGRTVLLSPLVISSPDWLRRGMSVAVTREHVDQSPPFELNQPLTREGEAALARHYGWPNPFDSSAASRRLQRVQALLGSTVEASDGSAGKLADVLIDDLTWEGRYLVVETGSWWAGKKVLLAPQWVDHLDAGTRTVQIKLARDAIKESPAYQPTEPVTPDYSGQLKTSPEAGGACR